MNLEPSVVETLKRLDARRLEVGLSLSTINAETIELTDTQLAGKLAGRLDRADVEGRLLAALSDPLCKAAVRERLLQLQSDRQDVLARVREVEGEHGALVRECEPASADLKRQAQKAAYVYLARLREEAVLALLPFCRDRVEAIEHTRSLSRLNDVDWNASSAWTGRNTLAARIQYGLELLERYS